MKLENPDVIIIGAGHNTLVAAAYLSACGLSVLVLEKNAYPGGGAVSREVTLPGYIHDTHATSVIHLQGHPLLVNDELQLKSKFGLEFVYPECFFTTLFSDRESISCYRDLDRSCAEIAKYSARDADAYRTLANFMGRLGPLISMCMSKPPISFPGFMGFLQQSDRGHEMIRMMMRSAYDIVMERFEHPRVQMHFLNMAAGMSCSPEEKTTGMVFLYLLGASHTFPAGAVVGGMQNLTRSLIRCIEHNGGEIRVNTEVTKVLNRSGRAHAVELKDGSQISAKRAIVGAIHPYHLADMVEGLPQQIGADAKLGELSCFAGLMIHCALNEPPKWHVGTEPDNSLIVNMVDYSSLEDFRRGFDALKYGELPQHFSGYTCCTTLFDKSRAPPDKHTLYFLISVPYELKDGGAARWDEIKERHADWLIGRLGSYASNMDANNIIARFVESPLDMERHSPSFVRGDMVGLASFIYQFFGQRPTPALAQYRVPGAEGLYLAGPFMHPGGGLTGGGRPVAIRILEDLKIPYHSVITS